jgi:hypothetical protein
VNFSNRKFCKKVKESKFFAALLVVDKCLLQQLDHFYNQDALREQCSFKHVELNSKLEGPAKQKGMPSKDLKSKKSWQVKTTSNKQDT